MRNSHLLPKSQRHCTSSLASPTAGSIFWWNGCYMEKEKEKKRHQRNKISVNETHVLSTHMVGRGQGKVQNLQKHLEELGIKTCDLNSWCVNWWRDFFVTCVLLGLSNDTNAGSQARTWFLPAKLFVLLTSIATISTQKLERVLNIAGERTQPFSSDATFFLMTCLNR